MLFLLEIVSLLPSGEGRDKMKGVIADLDEEIAQLMGRLEEYVGQQTDSLANIVEPDDAGRNPGIFLNALTEVQYMSECFRH